ncbi:MAG: transglycosylase SLT domain-containing protein [Bacillota bacterium]
MIRKVCLALASAALFVFCSAAVASPAGNALSREQNWAVLYASVVGTSYYADSLPASYDFPRTLTAVLAQESSLCQHKRGMDKTSYGCGQVRKPAAKLVNGEPVTAHKLQHNDSFNIRTAARYLSYCMQTMTSWERGVVCYNKGPYHARTMSDQEIEKDAYLNSIRHRLHEAQNLLTRVEPAPAKAPAAIRTSGLK